MQGAHQPELFAEVDVEETSDLLKNLLGFRCADVAVPAAVPLAFMHVHSATTPALSVAKLTECKWLRGKGHAHFRE
jgi:hypothetical protein